jgi:serine/threonine protein kinase/Flp pilus assembly protein TadD
MPEDPTVSLDDAQTRPAEMPAARASWGNFQLLARVGYGGFGEVYRAWDPSLEREVALKLLLPRTGEEAQSDAEYEAMLREARALASVRHPNIVPVYGIDRHDGRVGFWTDFVQGRTLSVLLGAQGAFGYREAALIGLDVARALSAVHRAGILHRDIKAENVMREDGGRILLMDFGLSTLPHGQKTTAGTPNYMAPEVWEGHPATVASDIYAMGVLLYHLVTGEYPVKLGGLTTAEVNLAIKNRRPLMDLRSDLPEPFLRVVNQALETDPAKRFSSAGQLAMALADCLGTNVPSDAIKPVEPAAKKKTWAYAAAAALLLVLLAAGSRAPAVRRWLRLKPAPVAAGISADTNDEYIKAQDLLKKSYKDSNVAEAVTIFQQILKENPKFALAQAGLGTAYFTQYRNGHDGKLLDLAKDATDTALAMEADLAPALATRARIEAAMGHPDLALKDATDAKNADSRSPEALAALAEAYQAAGRKDAAIEEILSAIAIDDKNSMLPVRLGNYYLEAGDLKDAAQQWQNAVNVDPQNTFAYFDLGVLNKRLDKLDDARQDFKKILDLGPDADTYAALGDVLQLEGKYDDAIQMDKKARDLDPTNPQTWANLASAYIWKGNMHTEAVEAYEQAIKLAEAERAKSPADVDILTDLAAYYASVGAKDKSLPLVRKALALTSNNPSIDYRAGETYELLGQRDKAIPLISMALAKGTRVNEFQRSPELASLRSDPAFTTAMAKAKADAVVDSSHKSN